MDPRRKMREILRQGLQLPSLGATSTPNMPNSDKGESSSSRDMTPNEDVEAESKALAGTATAAHLLLAPGMLPPLLYFSHTWLNLSRVDMDMSSAIALSKELHQKKGKRSHSAAFGDDDNPVHRPRFVSIEEASQVPGKAVRDELVKLYFQHFHPFCPVVDEFDFMEVYDGIENDEQLKKRVELPLFQAMMFVAIGVCVLY